MSQVFTGQNVNFSKIATGTPASFCRGGSGVSIDVDPHLIVKSLVGSKRHVIPGLEEVTGTFSGVVGVAKTDLAKFFPTTAGQTVADFPDFIVEVDDATTGAEWILTTCQPSSAKLSFTDGPDAELECEFEVKAVWLDYQAIGTDIPVYNSYLNYAPQHCVIQVGGADADVLSFDLSIDLGTEMFTPKNTKAVTEKRRPDAYYITKSDITLSIVTSDILVLNADRPSDTIAAGDLTITLNNGTGAQDILITCDSFICIKAGVKCEAEGMVGFEHEFIPSTGDTHNRVTFA